MTQLVSWFVGMRRSFRLLALALRADAKNLQRVRDIGIADLTGHALQTIGHAKVERLDAMAGSADDVVMMMLAGIELVPVGAVAEIAAADERDLFHGGETAIHRDQIAHALFHPTMQLFRGEWPMFASQDFQNRFSRFRDAMLMIAQSLEGALELGLRGRMLVGHAARRG